MGRDALPGQAVAALREVAGEGGNDGVGCHAGKLTRGCLAAVKWAGTVIIEARSVYSLCHSRHLLNMNSLPRKSL